MRCRAARALAPLGTAGELALRQQALVTEHLAQCVRCHQYYDDLVRDEQALIAAMPVTPAPLELVERTMRGIRSGATRRSPSRSWRIAAGIAVGAACAAVSGLVVVLILCGRAGRSEPPPLASSLGSIAAVGGRARVVRDGRTLVPEADMVLRVGDAVRTGSDGSMHVQFADGSCLRLGRNSCLDIAAANVRQTRPARLKFGHGLVSAWFTPGEECMIATPFASVSGQATRLCLRTDEEATRMAVREGRARFFNDHGRVVAAAMEHSLALPSKAPDVPHPATELEESAGEPCSTRTCPCEG